MFEFFARQLSSSVFGALEKAGQWNMQHRSSLCPMAPADLRTLAIDIVRTEYLPGTGKRGGVVVEHRFTISCYARLGVVKK
jgi:hypothetical protein